MRRFLTLLAVAAIGYAMLPTLAQAQVIYVQPRTYVAPIVTYSAPPVVQSYYAAPPITTYSAPATYSYYPQTAPVYSYSAPPVYTYSAPPVVTYSAPATYVVPATGVYTTHTYYGYGIFRPRGYYSQSYYTPLR